MNDAIFYRFGLHISKHAKRSILITGGLGFIVVYPALKNALSFGLPSATGWYLRESIPLAQTVDAALVQITPCFNDSDVELLRHAHQVHEEILRYVDAFCLRRGSACLSHTLFDLPESAWPAAVSLRNPNIHTAHGIFASARSLIAQTQSFGTMKARCLSMSYLIDSKSATADEAIAQEMQRLCRGFTQCQSSFGREAYELSTTLISPTQQSIIFCAYLAVFVYLFISFRRLRLVRSRIGLAVTSFVSIAFAVLGSFDLFYLADQSGSLSPLVVLPFMVLVLETENVFRATNAVVRVPRTLSPAQRMSEAMRTVGPIGLQALLTNLGIVCLFGVIGVSAMRQFCGMLAVAIVLSYALHLTFFLAACSIDVRRTELMDLLNERHQPLPRFLEAYFPVSTRRAGTAILVVFLFICQRNLPATGSSFHRRNLMNLPVNAVLQLLQRREVSLRVFSFSNAGTVAAATHSLVLELAQGHLRISLFLFCTVMICTYTLVTWLISESGDTFIANARVDPGGKSATTIPLPLEAVECIRLSPSKVLLILLDTSILLFDLTDNSRFQLGYAELGQQIWCLSVDGSILHTIGRNTAWRAWKLPSGMLTRIVMQKSFRKAEVLTASLDIDGLRVVWSDGQLEHFGCDGTLVNSIVLMNLQQAFFIQGRLLYKCRDIEWREYESDTCFAFEDDVNLISAIGENLAVVFGAPAGATLVYDLHTWELSHRLSLPKNAKRSIVIRINGKFHISYQLDEGASLSVSGYEDEPGQGEHKHDLQGTHWAVQPVDGSIVEFLPLLL